MSRSYRKTPIFGNASPPSETDDKETWHRRWRRKVRVLLRITDPDEYLDVDYREVSDPWLMNKDGKRYITDADEKDMRK